LHEPVDVVSANAVRKTAIGMLRDDERKAWRGFLVAAPEFAGDAIGSAVVLQVYPVRVGIQASLPERVTGVS